MKRYFFVCLLIVHTAISGMNSKQELQRVIVNALEEKTSKGDLYSATLDNNDNNNNINQYMSSDQFDKKFKLPKEILISPLTAAIIQGNLGTMQALYRYYPQNIAAGYKVIDSAGTHIPLHYAASYAKKNASKTTKFLLTKVDVDVNAVNSRGATALYIAAENGRADIAQVLLNNDANPALPENSEGITPLQIAQKNGHNDMVALLQKALQKEIDDPIRQLTLDALVGKTPAVEKNLFKVTNPNKYVRDVYKVDASQFYTLNPLSAAAISRKVNDSTLVFEFSKKRNEPPAQRESKHNVLTYLLAHKGDQKLKQPLDINAAAPTTNDTPLLQAALRGYEPNAYSLLMAGADPDIENIYQQTARESLGQIAAPQNIIFLEIHNDIAEMLGKRPVAKKKPAPAERKPDGQKEPIAKVDDSELISALNVLRQSFDFLANNL